MPEIQIIHVDGKESCKKQALTQRELRQFSGDLERFRHPINRSVIYTPGVRYVAEKADAYWLIDAIASHLGSTEYLHATVTDDRLCYFMVWTLEVTEDHSAILSARADSPDAPWVSQNIEFTDFPLDNIEVFAATDGRHWTLYLPSEH